ncbi:MAG: ABC transporter ATP-binding protein, partial [Anaerolineae bacterium]
LIGGFEQPTAGQIVLFGQDASKLPPYARDVNTVFQDYALFPHKDVQGNVAFGLRMAGLPADEIRRRIREALELVGLQGYERRRVTELSGGEQQRVALARSLAPRPRLLMLDEPLGALDRALREQLMNDLRGILKRVGVTSLYVTHDQEEAFALADRIVILRARPEIGEGGRVEQVGAPQEVYRRPASAYVARFLGFQNLIEGVVLGPWEKTSEVPTRSADQEVASAVLVETPLGVLAAADLARPYAAGERVTVLIRPEAANLCADGDEGPNLLRGRLRERSFRGGHERIQIEHLSGISLVCEIPLINHAANAMTDDVLTLHLDPIAISLL